MNAPLFETDAARAASTSLNSPSLIAAKKELRRLMKARLKEISVDRYETATAILRNLETLAAFRDAETLAVYLDFGSEAPTRPVLSSFFRRSAAVSNSPMKFAPETATFSFLKRRVAVPFCDGLDLRFYRIDEPAIDVVSKRPYFLGLEPRAFGILEPTDALRADPSRSVEPDEFDVVLIPGLAFDRNGGRLGRGAGYYDRFLSRLSSKTRLIGIAFDEQLVDSVPTSSLDVPVWAIATPTQIIGGKTDVYNDTP